MALGAGKPRELRRAAVERLQRSGRLELADEPRHAVLVGRDRRKMGVVERAAEPCVVAGIPAPARAQLSIFELETTELAVLRDPHLLGRRATRVELL